jgi:hypothetical protein
MAVLGDVILIAHDVLGQALLYHERVVIGMSPTMHGHYAVLTPDDDLYVEECLPQSDDIAEVRGSRGLDDTPPGIPAGSVYRFRAIPLQADMERHYADGALMVGMPRPVHFPAVRTVAQPLAVALLRGAAPPAPGALARAAAPNTHLVPAPPVPDVPVVGQERLGGAINPQLSSQPHEGPSFHCQGGSKSPRGDGAGSPISTAQGPWSKRKR